jgi:hypothetical protein
MVIYSIQSPGSQAELSDLGVRNYYHSSIIGEIIVNCRNVEFRYQHVVGGNQLAQGTGMKIVIYRGVVANVLAFISSAPHACMRIKTLSQFSGSAIKRSRNDMFAQSSQ